MPEFNVAGFLSSLLVILLSAKLFGMLAERLGQPPVLGELLGGVVLGFGLFPFFDPGDQALAVAAQFGVILLLFETGVQCDLAQLLKVGTVSLAVASVGMAAPFALGYALMSLMGHGSLQAIFVGAAMTATSVGITARVLSDIGKLNAPEAQIILGAAIIDDVLGIILLSAVSGIAATSALSWSEVGRTTLIAGAFTAGALLSRNENREKISAALKPVSKIFVPVFFVLIGAKVDLSIFNPLVPGNRAMILLAGLLVVLAVLGKIASGWAVRDRRINRLGIGFGMIPRGEVGLIFAQIGLASGVIEASLYGALVGMVVVTTFLAPPLLKRAFGKA